MADAEQKRTLQQSLRDTWLHALGVLGSAEHEVARAALRVMESVGFASDAEGKSVAGELLARVRRNSAELEHRVDEGVKAAVARVRQPFVQEIVVLRGRVEKLQRSIDEFKRRRTDKRRSGEDK